ncbi:tRNA pseudouridine(38-40) synthase TruA [Thalassoporum mexicanum]|uniref:tRNA pseudouridine(38-40) synthase TruA n=1 Tax=Thalassoporum mexicanum TaxID=3457544 RepID=UPI0005A29B10|nr:tRNA pseudouridine(38-40) synthase TruA [Pseudanabaena sp. PCC 7367]
MPKPKQRIALKIQYLGNGYNGWQRQTNEPSVQETIENLLTQVCGDKIVLHAAGRTDTGVHAAAQVAHFDTSSPIPAHKWAKVLSDRLPENILVRESVAVSPSWHARFSASWRRYRYVIYTAKLPNLFIQDYSWHFYRDRLDRDLIQQALAPMIGEQDLAAFQRAGSKRAHSRLNVHEAICWRDQDFIYIEVQASGFLYGMMRLLVGTLVDVGRSRLSVAEFTNIWQKRQRSAIKYAAPPQGLCLLQIGYPDNPFMATATEAIGDPNQRQMYLVPG